MRLTYVLVCLLPTLIDSANILGIFPVPSISHQKPFLNLGKELSKHHQVTLITPNPIRDKGLVNLTEIDISYLYDITPPEGFVKVLSSKYSLWDSINGVRSLLHMQSGVILENDAVKELVNKDNKFDLVIVEAHSPVFFVFGHLFNAPVIAISSLGVLLDMHDAVGNPTHPVLAPEIFMQNTGSVDSTFLERCNGIFYNIWYRLLYHWYYVPKMNKLVQQHFGNDLPSIADIQSQISMLMVTVNWFMDPIRPNVPTVINIERLHIDKPKPLPKDLQHLLDTSSEGIVYFSLGTNIKSSDLSSNILKTISEALESLPYTVLWKFEKDELPGKPRNIVTRKWLPQNDVLAHPNVKAFVTQGGLQSIEEAITSSVPMVGLPFLGDQPKNVNKLDKWGIGISLNPAKMTSTELHNAIMNVSTNPSFKKNIIRVRSTIEDQPLTGLEKAVWWVEYVLRHNGTKHLRYPAADMTFYKYLMLDIILLVLATIILISYVIVKLLFKFRILRKIKNICVQKRKAE